MLVNNYKNELFSSLSWLILTKYTYYVSIEIYKDRGKLLAVKIQLSDTKYGSLNNSQVRLQHKNETVSVFRS